MADSATEVPLYLDVCVDLDFLEMIAPKVSFFYIYILNWNLNFIVDVIDTCIYVQIYY